MLLSMTGYGKTTCRLPNKQIIIEIKTLNSKNADIFFKAPIAFREKETEMRNLIAKRLIRGKIECFITEEFEEAGNDIVINQTIIEHYLNQLKPILENRGIEINAEIFRSVLGMPGIYEEKQAVFSEKEWSVIFDALLETALKVQSFRKAEGSSMMHDILLHHAKIGKFLKQVPQFEEKRISSLSARWRKNIEQLKIEVDENRFEQELVFYLDKLDISEEKVRLANHIRYFEETINTKESGKGKKLGFIVQEMNREINTMGSKANDADIQKIVVQMKDELEKIREQLGNIL